MGIQVNLALAREGGIVNERLDRELESSVYRLVQEALTNVAKHAEAETVWIEVTADKTWISIVVRDDGIGFDMDGAPDRLRPDRNARARRACGRKPHDRLHAGRRDSPERPDPSRTPSPRPPPRRHPLNPDPPLQRGLNPGGETPLRVS